MNQYYPGSAPNSIPGYGPVFYGNNYAPKPQPSNNQPLTEEQIAKLRQKGTSFDWRVSEMDVWRSICTHKEKNGQSALVETAPDSNIWHCTICGATFNTALRPVEEVKAATRAIIDILQTAKSLYLDAPNSLISNYFQIIPILEKLPVLWERALENFNMYENNQTTSMPVYGNFYDGFRALDTIVMGTPWSQGPAGGYPPPPPPGYYPDYTQQAGGYYPQPPVPNGGYYPPPPSAPNGYAAPGNNPFMYSGQAAPGPAPAPGVIPAGTQAPPTAPPPAEGEIVQQKSFNV